jgi:hypothetical protein
MVPLGPHDSKVGSVAQCTIGIGTFKRIILLRYDEPHRDSSGLGAVIYASGA